MNNTQSQLDAAEDIFGLTWDQFQAFVRVTQLITLQYFLIILILMVYQRPTHREMTFSLLRVGVIARSPTVVISGSTVAGSPAGVVNQVSAAVPTPATIWLFSLGLLSLFRLRLIAKK